MSSSTANLPEPSIWFGPYLLDPQQVFFESDLTYGIVNLKPIVPGHVLLIPKRVAARFADLTPEEADNLWRAAYRIGPVLEAHYRATALNYAIQDGEHAGQSVPHVHIHILPRRKADFKRNDQVYEELEAFHAHPPPHFGDNRRPRTLPEMAAEAAELRTLFPGHAPAWARPAPP
eukprot:TRINITY_DN2893_c0_g1_i1.p2 TRINITY_DN2893_c0_g1~~TRINITY_DN2893_c0_g1_i1.p2  ORF type:complete len:175 (+),score=58.71 TRINITY_DN2893_c0_g1_i1:286-810(+)